MKNIYNIILSISIGLALTSCDNESNSLPDFVQFEENLDPIVPLLGLPADGTRCEIGEIQGENALVGFYWISTSPRDIFDLEITKLNTNEITTQKDIDALETQVSLQRGYSYSWRVVSKNKSSAKSESSDTWRFYLANNTIENAAPFPATVISPENGSIITPTNGEVFLEWEGIDPDENDTLTYYIRLDTENGTTPIKELQNLSAKSATITLEKGVVYYWSVISSDGAISVESNTFSFRLD
jgi:hypothetical protein